MNSKERRQSRLRGKKPGITRKIMDLRQMNWKVMGFPWNLNICRESSFWRRQPDRSERSKAAKKEVSERASEGRRGYGEVVERRWGIKGKGRRWRKKKKLFEKRDAARSFGHKVLSLADLSRSSIIPSLPTDVTLFSLRNSKWTSNTI